MINLRLTQVDLLSNISNVDKKKYIPSEITKDMIKGNAEFSKNHDLRIIKINSSDLYGSLFIEIEYWNKNNSHVTWKRQFQFINNFKRFDSSTLFQFKNFRLKQGINVTLRELNNLIHDSANKNNLYEIMQKYGEWDDIKKDDEIVSYATWSLENVFRFNVNRKISNAFGLNDNQTQNIHTTFEIDFKKVFAEYRARWIIEHLGDFKNFKLKNDSKNILPSELFVDHTRDIYDIQPINISNLLDGMKIQVWIRANDKEGWIIPVYRILDTTYPTNNKNSQYIEGDKITGLKKHELKWIPGFKLSGIHSEEFSDQKISLFKLILRNLDAKSIEKINLTNWGIEHKLSYFWKFNNDNNLGGHKNNKAIYKLSTTKIPGGIKFVYSAKAKIIVDRQKNNEDINDIYEEIEIEDDVIELNFALGIKANDIIKLYFVDQNKFNRRSLIEQILTNSWDSNTDFLKDAFINGDPKYENIKSAINDFKNRTSIVFDKKRSADEFWKIYSDAILNEDFAKQVINEYLKLMEKVEAYLMPKLQGNHKFEEWRKYSYIPNIDDWLSGDNNPILITKDSYLKENILKRI